MTREVMQQALEALGNVVSAMYVTSEGEAVALEKVNKAITAIKKALAQPKENT
jgi:methyl coenzyme M reductase subunit C